MALFESKPHTEFEKQLRFEALLVEISTFFINLPADQIDSEIEVAQRRVCEFISLDRSSLFIVPEEDPETLLLTHFYQPEGSRIPPEQMNVKQFFPWALGKVLGGETVTISKMNDLPVEIDLDRESFQIYGTKSVVLVPLSVGKERVFGLLAFSMMRRERMWTETVVLQFQLVAQIFAKALARKKVEEALKDRLEFEALLSDLSARFILVSPEQVNGEIEHALKEIQKFFQVDSSALIRIYKGKDTWEITHAVENKVACPLPVNSEIPLSVLPWICKKIVERHEVVVLESLRELPAEASIDKQTYETFEIKANLNIPVVDTQSETYCLMLNAVRRERTWPEVYIPRLRVLGEILGNALVRCHNAVELNRRMQEIEMYKQRLETENIFLQEEVKILVEHSEIVGQGPGIKKVLALAEQVALTDSTVLILGETGTGKELLARVLHKLSKRKDRLLVAVNTASLAPTLIESELFGREKGAYTGAMDRQIGRFELADGSSLFLDEIGDLAPELQIRLLRVLQEGQFERLGSPKSIRVNVRIIAATHRNLEEAVRQGRFREDLYYRLAVFPISIPPLRERTEDIPLLIRFFVNKFAEKMGKRIKNVPLKSIEALQQYTWPGNVRELRNVIERAVIVSPGDTLRVELPKITIKKGAQIGTLEETERQHIIKALEDTKWRIKGSRGAAKLLGLKPSTLYSTMSRLGIPTKKQKDDMSP